jgi:hypothetical protein
MHCTSQPQEHPSSVVWNTTHALDASHPVSDLESAHYLNLCSLHFSDNLLCSSSLLTLRVSTFLGIGDNHITLETKFIEH